MANLKFPKKGWVELLQFSQHAELGSSAFFSKLKKMNLTSKWLGKAPLASQNTQDMHSLRNRF